MFREFDPGNGTIYLVAFYPLTSAEQESTHLHGNFFAFGPKKAPIVGWVFRNNDLGDLGYRYFASKLQPGSDKVLSAFDCCAAFYAYCCLSDRQPHEAPQTPEQMGWKSSWMHDLIGDPPD